MVASFSAAATGGLQQQQRAGGQQHQQQQKVGMGLITASPSMEHLAGRSLQGTGEAAAQLVVADVELVIGSIMQLVNR
jgi:hypothetical protein